MNDHFTCWMHYYLNSPIDEPDLPNTNGVEDNNSFEDKTDDSRPESDLSLSSMSDHDIGNSTLNSSFASTVKKVPDNAKKELDHVFTNVLGLTPKDRLHVCINEHLRQHCRAIMTNVENIACEKWLLSLNLHEDKLRNFEFKSKVKFETLNESEIELILQLSDCVSHCWETTSTWTFLSQCCLIPKKILKILERRPFCQKMS